MTAAHRFDVLVGPVWDARRRPSPFLLPDLNHAASDRSLQLRSPAVPGPISMGVLDRYRATTHSCVDTPASPPRLGEISRLWL